MNVESHNPLNLAIALMVEAKTLDSDLTEEKSIKVKAKDNAKKFCQFMWVVITAWKNLMIGNSFIAMKDISVVFFPLYNQVPLEL